MGNRQLFGGILTNNPATNNRLLEFFLNGAPAFFA